MVQMDREAPWVQQVLLAKMALLDSLEAQVLLVYQAM